MRRSDDSFEPPGKPQFRYHHSTFPGIPGVRINPTVRVVRPVSRLRIHTVSKLDSEFGNFSSFVVERQPAEFPQTGDHELKRELVWPAIKLDDNLAITLGNDAISGDSGLRDCTVNFYDATLSFRRRTALSLTICSSYAHHVPQTISRIYSPVIYSHMSKLLQTSDVKRSIRASICSFAYLSQCHIRC
jgi:hypothetical protein